ncbi:hypothetical protein BRADI_4g36043v3 [Brachypodium distachyon]|uniref:Uncharacterized protein n=1 Tax=Brachypodium distachyon TaxID=15368 RepID=A0A2K2CSK2_BRADI|nr:hypothetical protein BRADI_4g36043v3 [Brachypodium distachyon]
MELIGNKGYKSTVGLQIHKRRAQVKREGSRRHRRNVGKCAYIMLFVWKTSYHHRDLSPPANRTEPIEPRAPEDPVHPLAVPVRGPAVARRVPVEHAVRGTAYAHCPPAFVFSDREHAQLLLRRAANAREKEVAVVNDLRFETAVDDLESPRRGVEAEAVRAGPGRAGGRQRHGDRVAGEGLDDPDDALGEIEEAEQAVARADHGVRLAGREPGRESPLLVEEEADAVGQLLGSRALKEDDGVGRGPPRPVGPHVRGDEGVVGDDLAPFLGDATEAAEVASREALKDAGEDVPREVRGDGGGGIACRFLLLRNMRSRHCAST